MTFSILTPCVEGMWLEFINKILRWEMINDRYVISQSGNSGAKLSPIISKTHHRSRINNIVTEYEAVVGTSSYTFNYWQLD